MFRRLAEARPRTARCRHGREALAIKRWAVKAAAIFALPLQPFDLSTLAFDLGLILVDLLLLAALLHLLALELIANQRA